MRTTTYQKLELLYGKYKGYITTKTLLDAGLTNRQIGMLTEESYLEKISHGHYWMQHCGLSKPFDYKCIEICLTNPNAIISLKSACYYQHILPTEPATVSVATARTDRSAMRMYFPVERHYFSDHNFELGRQIVQTEFGSYNIYNMERCLCDMMRLDHGHAEDSFRRDILNYIEQNAEQKERLLQYARLLRVSELTK